MSYISGLAGNTRWACKRFRVGIWNPCKLWWAGRILVATQQQIHWMKTVASARFKGIKLSKIILIGFIGGGWFQPGNQLARDLRYIIIPHINPWGFITVNAMQILLNQDSSMFVYTNITILKIVVYRKTFSCMKVTGYCYLTFRLSLVNKDFLGFHFCSCPLLILLSVS